MASRVDTNPPGGLPISDDGDEKKISRDDYDALDCAIYTVHDLWKMASMPGYTVDDLCGFVSKFHEHASKIRDADLRAKLLPMKLDLESSLLLPNPKERGDGTKKVLDNLWVLWTPLHFPKK